MPPSGICASVRRRSRARAASWNRLAAARRPAIAQSTRDDDAEREHAVRELDEPVPGGRRHRPAGCAAGPVGTAQAGVRDPHERAADHVHVDARRTSRSRGRGRRQARAGATAAGAMHAARRRCRSRRPRRQASGTPVRRRARRPRTCARRRGPSVASRSACARRVRPRSASAGVTVENEPQVLGRDARRHVGRPGETITPRSAAREKISVLAAPVRQAQPEVEAGGRTRATSRGRRAGAPARAGTRRAARGRAADALEVIAASGRAR